MSDYRFQIVQKHGLLCLHVMIDHAEIDKNGEEIIQTYIPLDDILASIRRHQAPFGIDPTRSSGTIKSRGE